MGLILETAPVGELLTLADVKSHLNIDDAASDTILQLYLGSAVAQLDGAQGKLNRALMTQTWKATFECFPRGRILPLPLPPLDSVTEVTYLDPDGVSQTLSADDYVAVNVASPTRQGGIELLPDKSWPATRQVLEAVTVTFEAGYGDASKVPAPVKLLVLLIVADSFENREPVSVGNVVNALPAMKSLFERCWFPVVP